MFPSIIESFGDWQQPLRFRRITKTITDFQVTEAAFERPFDGMLLTQTPQQLALKPEGQRTWLWWTLVTSVVLYPDDIVMNADNTQFRVMSKSNFAQAGFYNYEVVENYVNCE